MIPALDEKELGIPLLKGETRGTANGTCGAAGTKVPISTYEPEESDAITANTRGRVSITKQQKLSKKRRHTSSTILIFNKCRQLAVTDSKTD